MIQRVSRPRSLAGRMCVPGDKSISHRAFLFNAMSQGTACVRNSGHGADCLATLNCLRALGTHIDDGPAGEIVVHGRGGEGFAQPGSPLQAWESGTTIRLMCGLLAALPFPTVITGEAPLRRRPMDRIIEPLRLMGAEVTGSGAGGSLAPVRIKGGSLRGIEYRMPMASAQVKSAVLIAGLGAGGMTTVIEPAPSRDHTERMLAAMGIKVSRDGNRVSVHPGTPKPVDVDIPGDISSAAFWVVAACLHPNADILIMGVGVNPTRAGILDILREMGADVTLERERLAGGEPVADIRARSSSLRGIRIGGAMIPRAIDELPILALAGAMARGETEIRDAAELRVKESDRVASTGAALRALGASVDELSDGLVVHGGAALRGAACSSHGDHRLAMMLAVAGLVAEGETVIEGAESAGKSYPEFWEDLGRLSN